MFLHNARKHPIIPTNHANENPIILELFSPDLRPIVFKNLIMPAY